MSAVFEIKIYYKKIISPFLFLENMDIQYLIKDVLIMDNREYENILSIKERNYRDIEEMITKGKIFVLQGIINNKQNFGFNILKIDEVYSIEFWVALNDLEQLDNCFVTEETFSLYKVLIKKLMTIFNRKDLLLCAIGSEIFVLDSINIQEVIETSHNICAWIFPDDMVNNGLSSYSKVQLDDKYTIYFKLLNEKAM